jgi:hypothetical protein
MGRCHGDRGLGWGAQTVPVPRGGLRSTIRWTVTRRVFLLEGHCRPAHSQADFFCALNFAHLARCAAAILFRTATDMVRFFGVRLCF